MKKTILIIAIAVAAFALVSCSSLRGDDTMATISVSASATVSVKPDAATVSISSEALEATTEGARNKTSMMIENALEILKAEFGITDDDVKTNYMNVNPYYEWLEAGRTLVGQRATEQVSITLRGDAIEDAGKVYDRLSVLDGISISSVSFYKEDTSGEVAEARRLATTAAREKAEAYAEGLGMEVGAAISVSDGSSFSYTPYLNSKMYAVAEAAVAMDGGYSSTTYYSGDLEVSASVTVLFGLE